MDSQKGNSLSLSSLDGVRHGENVLMANPWLGMLRVNNTAALLNQQHGIVTLRKITEKVFAHDGWRWCVHPMYVFR